MRMTVIAILVAMTWTSSSNAFEYGCRLQPSDLNNYGTRVTSILAARKESLPKTIPLQSNFQLKSKEGQAHYYGTFEGFFRPENDEFMSIIPVPILGFDISKDRIVLYVCAHYSTVPEESHLTVYFLRGYHIDPPKITNFVGDLFYSPSLKVKPVPATLLGIGEIKKLFIQVFRFIPFVDLYFETFSVVQAFFANMLGDVTGFGVERIELTEKYVRVSSGVDLASPRNARISKVFSLKRPELGPAAGKSFKGSDAKIISDLEGPTPEYDVTTEEKTK